ncbi:MAG: C40 family peptidase [Deltaproteobacteria bacterium]|nr:C40 family peptidase [Deltaproteobacteria bacterium]
MALQITKSVHNYLGTPYVYGGRSPKGFDCSGLVWYVFRQHGVELPVSSYLQASVGKKVDFSELLPGDLLFFRSGKRIDHVGVYIGDGTMIHAPGRGKYVRKANLDTDYYRRHFVMARRVL